MFLKLANWADKADRADRSDRADWDRDQTFKKVLKTDLITRPNPLNASASQN